MRIAVIGDSVGMHADIPFEGLYHQLLARQLGQLFPGRVELLNFSVTGYDTVQEAAVLEQHALAFDPDVVLWQLHDNDGVRSAFYTFRGRYYDRPASYFAQALARRFDHLRMKRFLAARGLRDLAFEARHMAWRMDVLTDTLAASARTLGQKGVIFIAGLYPRWPDDDDWSRYGDGDRQLRRTLAGHLARVAASFGGRYISHVRSEDRRLEAAIEELIAIGREARLPVQISHFRLARKGLWGAAGRLLAMLDSSSCLALTAQTPDAGLPSAITTASQPSPAHQPSM